MKSINDSSITVENSGENNGAQIGTNSGIVVLQQGMNYNQTEDLCRLIVRDEIAKYREEALAEATKRNDELFDKFVQKLEEKGMNDTQALNEFRTPAMQYDYLEAQKAYIKAGTPELLELLSNILVKRISESERSLLQISLGEAIQVTPKLIPSQIASLALIFVVKYTRRETVISYETFADFLKDTIIPIFRSGVSQKFSEFQHLSFTGCCQQTAFTNDLIQLLKFGYAGLFMRGISQIEIPKDRNGVPLHIVYPDLFVRCLNNPQKLQIDAMNKAYLSSKISFENKDREKILTLFEENVMPDKEAQQFVEYLVPEMKDIFNYWQGSVIKNCDLSSVGVAIGAQYAHQITGQEYDMSIWI